MAVHVAPVEVVGLVAHGDRAAVALHERAVLADALVAWKLDAQRRRDSGGRRIQGQDFNALPIHRPAAGAQERQVGPPSLMRLHGSELGGVMRHDPPLVRKRRHAVARVRRSVEGAHRLRVGPRRSRIDHAFQPPAEVHVVRASEALEEQFDTATPCNQTRRHGDDVLGRLHVRKGLDGNRGLAGAPRALGLERIATLVNRGQHQLPRLVEPVVRAPRRRLLPGQPGRVVRIHGDIHVHGQQRQVADLDCGAERAVGFDATGEDVTVMPDPGVPGQPDALTG